MSHSNYDVPARMIDLLEAVDYAVPATLPSGKRLWIVSEGDKLALDRLKASAERASAPEDDTQPEDCRQYGRVGG